MLFPVGRGTLTAGSDALVEEVRVERILDSFFVVQVVHVYHFFPQGQESVIISLIFEDLRLKLLLSFLEWVQPMCSGPSLSCCSHCLSGQLIPCPLSCCSRGFPRFRIIISLSQRLRRDTLLKALGGIMWLQFFDITPCLPFLPPQCLLQYHLLLLEATLPLSQCKDRLYLLDCGGCFSLAVHYSLELG
jgi:hypothetical protein